MQQLFTKARLFGNMLFANPQEAADRLATLVQVRWEQYRVRPPVYAVTDFNEVIAALETELNTPVKPLIDEAALQDIRQHVRYELERFSVESPFMLGHNADLRLATLQYALCRAMKPSVVIETGVAYGVSSAFILRALAENNHGELFSVDLPLLATDADRYVGFLVPQHLRSRWHLYRGASKRVLPKVLAAVESVDMFIHDSLHTYQNMRYEFNLVAPRFSERAVLISDDVGDNPAFFDWVAEAKPRYWAVVAEADKASTFGVAVP